MSAPRDPRVVLVALGGAAVRAAAGGRRGAPALGPAVAPAVDLLAAGFRVVLVSGRGRAAARDGPAAQGTGGHALAAALEREGRARGLELPVAGLLTRVLVDPVVAGAGRPRARPAVRPLRVLEAGAVRQLLASGTVPVVAGAGAVTVAPGDGALEPVAAAPDADLVAETLATAVGADRLLLLTGVEQVVVGFRTARAIAIERLPLAEARLLLGAHEFPPGTIGVKLEAAVRFVEAGGHEAIITTPARAADAVAGRAGTRVVG